MPSTVSAAQAPGVRCHSPGPATACVKYQLRATDAPLCALPETGLRLLSMTTVDLAAAALYLARVATAAPVLTSLQVFSDTLA